MHRLTSLVAVSCLLLLAPSVRARQDTRPTRAPAFATWDDARLQTYITGSLKEGRFYTRAIQASQELIKRNPKSLQAHIMLGCASASRYASLGVTLSEGDNYKWFQEHYQEKKAAWEKAQQDADPTVPQKRPPVVPPTLVTPDDGRPFTLTKEQANQELVNLARQTITAFEAARALSGTGTSDEKLQCELARGWGLFLLRQGRNQILQDGPVSKNADAAQSNDSKTTPAVYLSQADIVDSFERCVKLAPDNPQAWHSLALSLVPNRVLITGGGWDESSTQPNDKRAAEAMDKAVALKPKDFDLLYQAGAITTKVDAARSVNYLKRALQRQGTNAVVWYVLADRLFKQAEKMPDSADKIAQQAKDTFRSGNSAPLYQPPAFALPVPAFLKRPWQYLPVYGQEQDAVIAQYLWRHLETRIKNAKPNDETEVLTDAPLLMNLGFRMVGSINVENVRFADPSTQGIAGGRVTIGSCMCLFARDFLKNYAPAMPSQAYTELQEQYQVLAKQARDYMDTFQDNLY